MVGAFLLYFDTVFAAHFPLTCTFGETGLYFSAAPENLIERNDLFC